MNSDVGPVFRVFFRLENGVECEMGRDVPE